MNKDESQILKGVFILLMLFLHLFNHINTNVDFCLYINDIPLLTILSRAANPVSFFLIVSGYGLFITSNKNDKKHYSRILNLYINYWLISAIFLALAYFICPGRYSYDVVSILNNFTGLEVSYNHPMWFILPFSIISLSYPLICKIIKHYNSILLISILFILNIITSYKISRYGYYNNLIINNLFLSFHLLFAFCTGAIMAKENIYSKLKNHFSTIKQRYYWNIILSGLILLIVILQCIVNISITNTFYSAAFIIFFILLNRNEICDKCLTFLGGAFHEHLDNTCFYIYIPFP